VPPVPIWPPVPLAPPVLGAPPLPDSSVDEPPPHAVRKPASPRVSKQLRASRDLMRLNLRGVGARATTEGQEDGETFTRRFEPSLLGGVRLQLIRPFPPLRRHGSTTSWGASK